MYFNANEEGSDGIDNVICGRCLAHCEAAS